MLQGSHCRRPKGRNELRHTNRFDLARVSGFLSSLSRFGRRAPWSSLHQVSLSYNNSSTENPIRLYFSWRPSRLCSGNAAESFTFTGKMVHCSLLPGRCRLQAFHARNSPGKNSPSWLTDFSWNVTCLPTLDGNRIRRLLPGCRWASIKSGVGTAGWQQRSPLATPLRLGGG